MNVTREPDVECDDCGAAVMSTAIDKHSEWHAGLEKSSEIHNSSYRYLLRLIRKEILLIHEEIKK